MAAEPDTKAAALRSFEDTISLLVYNLKRLVVDVRRLVETLDKDASDA